MTERSADQVEKLMLASLARTGAKFDAPKKRPRVKSASSRRKAAKKAGATKRRAKARKR